MKFKYFVLVFLLLTCFSRVNAQFQRQFRFINYGKLHGMDQSYVYNCTQDQHGQMWFATFNGLYSYDSRYFQHYSPKFETPGKSINNVLTGLYYDHKTQRLWCASKDCFLWFNTVTKEFEDAQLPKEVIDLFSESGILNFFRDKVGNMWISTSNKGLLILDANNKLVQNVQPRNGQSVVITSRIYNFDEDEVMLVSDFGLYLFNISTYQARHYQFKSENYFSDVVKDGSNNAVWITTAGSGLLRLDLENEQFKQFIWPEWNQNKLINNGIFQTVRWLDKDELILDGFNTFNTKTLNFSKVSVEKSFQEFALTSYNVTNTFEDRESNIWFCSWHGIAKLVRQNQFNKTIQILHPEKKFGIEFTQLAVAGNELFTWSSAYSGLLGFDQSTQQYLSFPFKNQLNTTVFAICKVTDHSIWVSTNLGVFNFDIKSKQFTKLQLPLDASLQNQIIYMYQDKEQNIWLTVSYKGTYVLRKNTDLNFRLAIDAAEFNAKKNLLYIDVCTEDKLGNVAAFSTHGVFIVNKKTLITRKIPDKIKGLDKPFVNILSMCYDNANHLWIADSEIGLVKIEFLGKEIIAKKYSEKSNLSVNTNFIAYIEKDDQGYLWISTAVGLYCIDPIQEMVRNIYQKEHGMSSNGFVRKLYFNNNKLWVFDWSSFIAIDLSKNWNVKLVPQLLISNFKMGKNSETLWPKMELELPHDLANISFNVGSNNYINEAQTRYFYQLIGYDNSIKEMGRNYQVQYNSIPPGKYLLQVWCVNYAGIKSEIKSFKLTILKPFYKRTWFLLLSALILGMLVYYLYQQRISSVRKEASLEARFKQQLAETEMKALRAQMNPHFMFNALNSIQKYILKNEPQLASQYLTKFSRLIRIILDQSQKNTNTIEEELELLRIYTDLEKMRFDQQFVFIVNVDESINVVTTLIPSMLIQPYIENSIWHGLLHKDTAGKVSLTIDKTGEGNLKITIEDDGIGRTKAKEINSKNVLKDKSYGMSISQQRLKNFTNKFSRIEIIDIVDENNNPTGTRVEILLPFNTIQT